MAPERDAYTVADTTNATPLIQPFRMAHESVVRNDLTRLFDSAVTDDAALMKECLQICSDYNVSGEDLFFKWEAFSYNNVPLTPTAGTSRTIQRLTLDGAKALRAHIAREAARSNEKRTVPARVTNARLKGGAQSVLAVRLGRGGTSNAPSVPPGTLDDRISSPSSVIFVGPTPDDLSRRSYRYMFEKISTRSEVLDDWIDGFSELIREKYEVEELGDPASVTEDIVTVVGRLCLDPETDAASSLSKLSSGALVLEPSRMGGSGERVPLKFDPDFTIRDIPDISIGKSLFPGEIVALRGRNGGGGWFSIKEILPVPSISPAPKVSPKDLSVLVASGPYTSDQNIDFGGFYSIIEEAKSLQPSVLLLLGPFIDTSHPSVKSGKLSSSPLSIFRQAFLNPIHSYLQKNTDTLVLLVPSIRDLLSSHNAFPQGVGEGDFGRLPSAIKVLPNPCLFSLNGVRFGVSTVDILFHLKSQQHIQKPQPPQSMSNRALAPELQDSMASLCQHILEQRSFYPLFPAPLELSADVNLDVSHSEYLRLGDPAPDVLVLSSVFRQFSKSVKGISVLNPSVFGKSHVAAELYIPAGAGGKVCDVIRVDFKRLG